MNSDLVRALYDKYVYINIDGTLAEYHYNNHVSAKDGSGCGVRIDEINEHVYLNSRPLESVIKVLSKSYPRRVSVYSTAISLVEVSDKIEWLQRNCQNIPIQNYLWFVPKMHWKKLCEEFGVSTFAIAFKHPLGYVACGNPTRVIEYINSAYEHHVSDAVILDSNPEYLQFAEDRGATAYHVSSFMD